MTSQEKADFKRKIKREAQKLGINKIGFANVERWSEFADIH